MLVIQDASGPDARDVVTPGVLGLELGLEGSGLEMRIVEASDLDPAQEVSDEGIVAVVVAPFTDPLDGSLSELRNGGLAVLSLSELTTTEPAGAPIRAFVPPVARQADAAAELTTCAAGDGSVWSDAFLAELPSIPVMAGGPTAVATEAAAEGCGGLVWTGGASEGAALAGLVARTAPGATYVVTSRGRTAGFAEATDVALRPQGLCPCVDLTTSADPGAQRFVHAYQAANGLDPGPFAVEGFDAGRLIAAVANGRARRASIAETLAGTVRADGLGGPYLWNDAGGLSEPSVRMYERVGLRWLERRPTRVAGGGTRA